MSQEKKPNIRWKNVAAIVGVVGGLYYILTEGQTIVSSIWEAKTNQQDLPLPPENSNAINITPNELISQRIPILEKSLTAPTLYHLHATVKPSQTDNRIVATDITLGFGSTGQITRNVVIYRADTDITPEGIEVALPFDSPLVSKTTNALGQGHAVTFDAQGEYISGQTVDGSPYPVFMINKTATTEQIIKGQGSRQLPYSVETFVAGAIMMNQNPLSRRDMLRQSLLLLGVNKRRGR